MFAFNGVRMFNLRDQIEFELKRSPKLDGILLLCDSDITDIIFDKISDKQADNLLIKYTADLLYVMETVKNASIPIAITSPIGALLEGPIGKQNIYRNLILLLIIISQFLSICVNFSQLLYVLSTVFLTVVYPCLFMYISSSLSFSLSISLPHPHPNPLSYPHPHPHPHPDLKTKPHPDSHSDSHPHSHYCVRPIGAPD